MFVGIKAKIIRLQVIQIIVNVDPNKTDRFSFPLFSRLSYTVKRGTRHFYTCQLFLNEMREIFVLSIKASKKQYINETKAKCNCRDFNHQGAIRSKFHDHS